MALPSARNWWAIVSFIASLFVPMEALLIVLAMQPHSPVSLILAGGIGSLALPATVIAIVFGHVALVKAKQYAPGHGLRGFAIAGLALGYLAAVAGALILAVFILAGIMTSGPASAP
jgi:hypothetical protein